MTDFSVNSFDSVWDRTWGKKILPTRSMLFTAMLERTPPREIQRAAGELRSTPLGEKSGLSKEFFWPAAVWEVLRIRRTTPNEWYVSHRSYPCVRGLRSTDVEVNMAGILPLLQISGAKSNLPSNYGNFRRSLVNHEIGHLFANLQMVGWNEGFSLIPQPIRWEDSQANLHVIVEQYYPTVVSRLFPHFTGWTIGALFNNRTSGPTPVENEAIPLRNTGEVFKSFSNTIQKIATETFLIDYDLPTVYILPDEEATTLVWVANVMTVRDGELDHLELVCGWWAQWLCLFAAVQDLSARPFRAFDEADFASRLRLAHDQQPLYALRITKTRPSPLERIQP